MPGTVRKEKMKNKIINMKVKMMKAYQTIIITWQKILDTILHTGTPWYRIWLTINMKNLLKVCPAKISSGDFHFLEINQGGLMRTIKIIFAVCLIFSATMYSFAEEQENSKIDLFTKRLSGEIAGVSSNFLAVTYAIDKKGAHEMTMTIDENAKVLNKKGVKDLRNGDVVSIVYEETSEKIKVKKEDKEVEEVKVRGRVAKLITVNKAAPEPEAIVTNTLVSDANPEASSEDSEASEGTEQ